jgi:predicted ATP-grasp superfamily ATP-dependent carboligase
LLDFSKGFDMSTRKMDSFEILKRAQQPQELADERKRDAKKLIHAMQAKDDDVSARMAKLKALRLAKEAEDLANAPPPVEKKKPAVRKKAAAKS